MRTYLRDSTLVGGGNWTLARRFRVVCNENVFGLSSQIGNEPAEGSVRDYREARLPVLGDGAVYIDRHLTQIGQRCWSLGSLRGSCLRAFGWPLELSRVISVAKTGFGNLRTSLACHPRR